MSRLPGALALALMVLHAAPAAADNPAQCLALSLYWEARGDGPRGMEAVGWVVLNRVAHPEFPASVCAVVEQGGPTPPCQFSWWCDGRSDRPRELDAWRAARAIAARLLRDPPPDPTARALFFHDVHVGPPWPELKRTATIGSNVFYR